SFVVAPAAAGRLGNIRGKRRKSRLLAADKNRRGRGIEIEIDDRHPKPADQADDGGLAIETAADQAEMRAVGRKLVQRRIDRQPESAPAAFVAIYLGPGVVVERALRPPHV